MAEGSALIESKRCCCFFLYDSSKVVEEGDLTREGICYFYPEDTPIGQQELLCGQLAGVCRCVSELSSSPVHLLRLRKSKYAVCMKDNFIWGLSCVVDIPDVSVCDFLHQLIALFCFYNGPVRQSYTLHSREELALRWARYLCHLQGGSTELHNIFSCLRTIDSTHIDPLLLLKAALILQACQRCPLVLAGCILYRGRVVSTQMPPALTVKVMVHETETYSHDYRVAANGVGTSAGTPPSFTQVFLTPSELQMLRCPPVDRNCRSHCAQAPCQPRKSRLLSRTLSDTPTTDTESLSLDPSHRPPVSYQTMPSSTRSSFSDEMCFTPSPSLADTPLHSGLANQSEYFTPESHDHSMCNGDDACHGKEQNLESEKTDMDVKSGSDSRSDSSDQEFRREEVNGYQRRESHSGSQTEDTRWTDDVIGRPAADPSLLPSLLYQHRVRGLVLALLVEPEFNTDTNAREEVHHSSMASLNGLEAHLRNTSPGTPGPPGLYTFAHYDCIQNTLTTNVCGRSAGPLDRSFVRATALLHSHFSSADSLQEAIVRNASLAVYGTQSSAQETYFLQQGTPVRNSGSPDAQDSAFSLPRKARQRLLKHGVNLL